MTPMSFGVSSRFSPIDEVGVHTITWNRSQQTLVSMLQTLVRQSGLPVVSPFAQAKCPFMIWSLPIFGIIQVYSSNIWRPESCELIVSRKMLQG